MKPIILTITGPSCSGKTVLARMLRARGFEPLVSTTTRLPRQGEIDGVDYHFVSNEQFNALEQNNGLIESIQYDSNRYGISSAEAERAFGMGKPAVLVAEPHGVAQIHEYCRDRGWDTLRVFVTNPLSVLVGRVLERFHEDTANLAPGDTDDGRLLTRKVDVYAARIQKIAGFEQENWVKPAFDASATYELLFDRFDAGNETEVIERITEAATAAMNLDACATRKPKR